MTLLQVCGSSKSKATFLIPSRAVGRIMGKKGVKIKELTESTTKKITQVIESLELPENRMH